MPHLDLTQEELDRLHPSLAPPCDERLDDLTNDADDAVYLKGLKLAEEIRSETSQQGRRRHPSLSMLKVKQQQLDESSSSRYRASTIRPLGGGVISGATTYTPTATDTTTTTTSLDIATTTTTTDARPKTIVTEDVQDVKAGRRCGQLGSRADRGERQRQSLSASLHLLKCPPKVFELILTD